MKCALVLLAIATVSCQRRALSEDECRSIVARIMDLELAERGVSDPALARQELAKFWSTSKITLSTCQGRRVRLGAMECLREARSTEEIAHRCLE